MKTKLFLCGAALGALSLPALAAPAPQPAALATPATEAPAPVSELVSQVDIPYQQFTLDNGLRV